MTTSLGRLEDFPLDTPTQVTVNGDKYLIVRRGEDDVCVVRDRCPHLGFSLSTGPGGGYEDGVITCPWHNSRFDVCSGQNLDWATGFAGVQMPGWSRRMVALGKSPAPLVVLDVAVHDGEIVLADP